MGIMKRQHNISMFTTALNKFKNWDEPTVCTKTNDNSGANRFCHCMNIFFNVGLFRDVVSDVSIRNLVPELHMAVDHI